jgi:hypothetical protein
MIDIVYVLGNGSRWKDNEIRFSLRSIEKHGSGFRNVYIIGNCPVFLKKVFHIPFPDRYNREHGKERNIATKLLRACECKALSDRFIFFNDDHFLLHDVKLEKFPYYHRGFLQESIAGGNQFNNYKKSMRNTLEALRLKGLKTVDFDIHTPIVYDKEQFPRIISQFDWNLKWGYVIKSLYGNSFGMKSKHLLDGKINSPHTVEGLQEFIKGKAVLSIGDRVINDSFQQFMLELYPKKSRWEK